MGGLSDGRGGRGQREGFSFIPLPFSEALSFAEVCCPLPELRVLDIKEAPWAIVGYVTSASLSEKAKLLG